MRKILFLDIDGVLATPETLDKSDHWTFTPRCVEQLRRIVDAVPGLEVVLSSSWRKRTVEATRAHLVEEGFPEDLAALVIGVTVRGYEYIQQGVAMSIPRGVEIKQWLDHNVHSGGNGLYVPGENGTFVRKGLGLDYTYVILDDDTDMLLEHYHRFVRTDRHTGLTRNDAERVIRILGEWDVAASGDGVNHG